MMLLSSPDHICKAYSEGRIGWREAVRLLKLEDYSAFAEMFRESGYPLPMPDPEESAVAIERLDALLYDESER